MSAEDKTDWKELHRFAQQRGFGLMGLLTVRIMEKFPEEGEKVCREFYFNVGQISAKAFLEETKPPASNSDFQNYCDWQLWFMSSQRADNSGSELLPLEQIAPGHVRAKRIGCMINNAFAGMGITDVPTRKLLCAVFTEIDYGVRDIIGKDCVEFVRFDCQGEREHGDPQLPQGNEYCIFEIKAKS